MFLSGIPSVADTNPSRQRIAGETPEKTQKNFVTFASFRGQIPLRLVTLVTAVSRQVISSSQSDHTAHNLSLLPGCGQLPAGRENPSNFPRPQSPAATAPSAVMPAQASVVRQKFR